MLQRVMFAIVCAWALAGCGDDCGSGGSSFFGGSSDRAALAPQYPTVSTVVRVDRGDTVLIELTQTTNGSACYPGQSATLRFVWDPVMFRAVATTAVPSTSARTVTGVVLGGGATTYEDVIPGLTIRISGGTFGAPEVITFSSGTQTSTLTCQTSGTLSCA